jgi:muramidase (phage lysozyme)
MDQELRDLVEQMRQLNLVLQGMNKPPGTAGNQSADKMNRGVDRMVVALGQLVVKLDATKKTQREEQEAVKKFANAVERTAKNLDNENKEREAVTEALLKEEAAREEANRRRKLTWQAREQEDKEQALKKAKHESEQRNRDIKSRNDETRQSKSSSKELFDSLSSTGGSAEMLKNKFLNLGGDSLVAQSGLQVFSAGLSGTAKSLTTFASGLLNGERGAQLSARALNDFATPILDAAASIGKLLALLSFIPGPIGFLTRGARIAGAAVLGLGAAAGKAALKFNELGAKQLDILVKSFNDVSGAGISLTGGLEGTLDLMHTLNMTTADAAQFQEMLGKNTKQLALLGGTAGVGAKRFAEVSGALVKSNIGQTFEIMGITQQEQREAALLYMSIQARTGQMQLKNTEKLIEESARFVYELDQAAQLTGATRREQQEAREAAMTEVRFRAALVDARQRGDSADTAQLLVAQRVSALLKTLGDEKGAIGALQQSAGQGALTTPEAIAAEQTYRISEILAQPNITDQQILAHLAKGADVSLQSLASANRLNGNIDSLQTGIIGMVNVVDRQNALTEAAEAASKAGFTGPDAITKYLEEQQRKRKQPGGDLELMVSAGRALQAAAQIQEQGIKTYNVAADINKAASETFAKAVKEFGNILGVTPVPGGTPTFGSSNLDASGRQTAASDSRVASATAATSSAAKTATTQSRVTAESALAEATANRIRLEKEKGAGSPEVRAARVAEFRAKRQAELAGMAEQTAQSKSSRDAGVTGQKPTTSATKILDLIGRAESGGNYNILVGGKTNADLTNMTIAQVLDYQSNMRAQGHETTAVGKYQILQKTLQGLLKQGVVSPNETFSPSTQDKLAIALLNQRGWPNYQSGKITADQMADAIAKEWAGFPLANGQSAYQGVGSNKATVGRQEVLTALTDVPKARDGGMFKGPMSGYPAVLHGNEAVIPLKNGAVPVMMPALDELVSSNRAVDAQVQVLRNEMGSMMRELTTAIQTMKETGSQERMIQLLESMSRSQQSTATATQRMAQLASN